MLSITDKISFRERQILIHSYLYYHEDTNVISDKMYDKLSYGLVDIMNKYPDEFKASDYASCFLGFDGTTGFDLIDKLTEEELYRIKVLANVLKRPHY